MPVVPCTGPAPKYPFRAIRLPWPQHFDGKYWQNEFAVKYGIQSIPAMFLLDQDGKLVTTEARGERLEQEVKRLLNL